MKKKENLKMKKKRSQKRLELDLEIIFQDIFDKFIIIILAGIITAFIFILFTQLFIVPEYESQTKLFVLSKQSSASVTSSDMESSASLTQDYVEVIQSRTVLEKTISDLNLDMTYDELQSGLLVTSSVDTRIITVETTAEDPYTAASIADKICSISMRIIQETMEVETINIIEPAEIPLTSVRPSLTKNGLIGGITGIIFISACFVIRRLTDTTIKNSQDVKYYLGLETLGSIPLSETKKGNI